jgi:uncharacterized membrane protein
MHTFLSELLSDKKGGMIFTCFGIWHICFIVLFFAIGIGLSLYLKDKDNEKRKRLISIFINLAFTIYIADFFLMPLAYSEIDIEKLPFHICTTMCIMCFLSRRNNFFAKFKLQFAALGFLSNLIYLVYPAGVMWHAVHPLSYRVIQTLFFHGVMMVYGMLVLIYEFKGFNWKTCYRDLIVTVLMTLWALLGNAIYNNQARVYNWFFVVRDPFNMFSQSIAPYIMPILNVVLFFVVEIFVYLIFSKITKQKS